MFNSKAKAQATLCAMLPFRFIAEWIGYSREYLYKRLREDSEASKLFKRLIGFDAHVSSYFLPKKDSPDETVRAFDGTLFATRATPTIHAKDIPRAAGWDWKREWRNLHSDVSNGRTVQQAIEQLNKLCPRAERRNTISSHTQSSKAVKAVFEIVKNFFYLSSTAFNTEINVNTVCEPDGFRAVQDAISEPVPNNGLGRSAWVQRLANSVYQCVGDSTERDMNGWLARAWTVAKAVVYDIGQAREVFLEALYTVLHQSTAGKVRNLGAYLNSVLKSRGWEMLEEATADVFIGAARTA
jgi:hypothetical protein